MDGHNSLNIIYIKTFDGLGITRSTLTKHDAIPDHQAYPLEQITLSVMFGDLSNFCTQ